MRSLSINKAFKEYLEIEKNDRNVYEFYKRYKDIFRNIDSLNDPDEAHFFCLINFDFAIALIKRQSYEKAIEVLLKIKEMSNSSGTEELKEKFKYLDYHISLCYFSLKNYKLAEKYINNFKNIDKDDEPEIYNLKESISIYFTKKLENIILISATVLLLISSFLLSQPNSIYLKTLSIVIILSSFIFFLFRYKKFESISTLDYLKNGSSSIYIYTLLFLALIMFSFFPHKLYNGTGNFLKAYGLHNSAINLYSKSIIKNPNYPSSYNSRGVLFLYENKLKESIDDFNKAINLSKSPIYYKNRALSYFLLGKQDEGMDDINSAKSIIQNSDFSNTCQYIKNECGVQNKNACKSLEVLTSKNICN